MNPMVYVFSGILVVLAGVAGWFIRNKVMVRQLLHTRSKLTDLESLHVNLQNETSLLRQKGRDFDDLKRSLDNVRTELAREKEQTGEKQHEMDTLRSQLSETTREKVMIGKLLAELESENATLSQTSAGLDKENNSLRTKISELNDHIAQLENSSNGTSHHKKPPRSRKPVPRDSQSTEKFKKKKRPEKDVSSTGIRMLEKIAEEVRDPDQTKNETRKE
jgi:chromosome segregation ATPase